jgi:hypothetical protein
VGLATAAREIRDLLRSCTQLTPKEGRKQRNVFLTSEATHYSCCLETRVWSSAWWPLDLCLFLLG